MGKYSLNLINKFERMNNSIKWIIIILAIAVITIVVIIGVVPKLREVKPSVVPVNQQQNVNNTTVNINPALLSSNEQLLKVNYVKEFQGYKITGISIESENSAAVYLEKDQSTQEYRVGDIVTGNFFINEIHWAHIILTDNNSIIHLNNTN